MPNERTVPEEIVEKALNAVGETRGLPIGNAIFGPLNIDKEAMRAALEAVWPEPILTQGEIKALLLESPASTSLGDSARAKLEAMLDK